MYVCHTGGEGGGECVPPTPTPTPTLTPTSPRKSTISLASSATSSTSSVLGSELPLSPSVSFCSVSVLCLKASSKPVTLTSRRKATTVNRAVHKASALLTRSDQARDSLARKRSTSVTSCVDVA